MLSKIRLLIGRAFYLSFCFIFIISTIPFIVSATVKQKSQKTKSKNLNLVSVPVSQQNPNLKIVSKDRRLNPLVNEGNTAELIVIDSSGNQVTNIESFESDNPDIVDVIDPKLGVVKGIKSGYGTVTARTSNGEFVSTIVAVPRVKSGKGTGLRGEIKVDSDNSIYSTDPLNHVIFKQKDIDSSPFQYAGRIKDKGNIDGQLASSLFNGCIGIDIDRKGDKNGGFYISDKGNHNIRKITKEQVVTVLGSSRNIPGINSKDETPFEEVLFTGPEGVAVDIGGNLFIADTENHAIYYADFAKRKLFLLAGEPGLKGNDIGVGRKARLNRPTTLTLKRDKNNPISRSLLINDKGNNCLKEMRIIQDSNGKINGDVVFSECSNNKTLSSALSTIESNVNELILDEIKSIGSDELGNIYISDKTDVKVISNFGNNQQVSLLAQPGTFTDPSGIFLQGNKAFVLDANANTSEAAKVVTFGSPEIISVTPTISNLEGGITVIVLGRNFSADSQVVLGDGIAQSVEVMSSTELRFKVPRQNAPGTRTLSVQTRGGVAQKEFSIIAKEFFEIASGDITTLVGGIPFVGDDGTGVKAILNRPTDIKIDSLGNLLIVDTANHRIRKLDSTNVITTIVGNGIGGFSGDGGPAISASLNAPTGIVLDQEGNIFIADSLNNRIRRVDAKTNIITTIAGTGEFGFEGDGFSATSAKLNKPNHVAIDKSGDLFVVDTGNHCIRRINNRTSSKIITTIAGKANKFGFDGDGEIATNAILNNPTYIAFDNNNNLLIADTFNHRIRQVDNISHEIKTIAGRKEPGFNGNGILSTDATLNNPVGIIVDSNNNLFIADSKNNAIRKISATDNKIDTITGDNQLEGGFGGDGEEAKNAKLNTPTSMVLDNSGNIFVIDQFNNRVRKVTDNKIFTIVGTEQVIEKDNIVLFGTITAIALDQDENIVFADGDNNIVRRVNFKGGKVTITDIAGNGNKGSSGDGGLATEASLNFPEGLAIDSQNNIYIAERDGYRIRKVNAETGEISTVAGNGRDFVFNGDGIATNASIRPFGVAVDSTGNYLFIADYSNHRIRRVDMRTNMITTVAGNGEVGSKGDGGQASFANLHAPFDVVIDKLGNLFVADSNNHRIRRIDVRGIISTIVNIKGELGNTGDGGTATDAKLAIPSSLALDTKGNLFIADRDNHRIRKVILATGRIETVAGTDKQGFRGDGGLATNASLSAPRAIVVNSAGNLIIGDSLNNAIRIVR